MKVSNVFGFNCTKPVKNFNNAKNLSFEAQFKNDKEKQDYTDTINRAMDYLGIQNRAFIIHGASFPAKKGSFDQQVGTPYGNNDFIDFVKTHGFNSIQLGPMGRLNRGDSAPYSSSIVLKNPLFIDMPSLTTDNYANLLTKEDIKAVVPKAKSTSKNYTRADFEKAREISSDLIETAYDNFCQKLEGGDERAEKLFDEFDDYKTSQGELLDYYAVLDRIAEENGTDYYPYWPKEDAELIPLVKKGDKNAINRYNQIMAENERDIDVFKFSQFLIDKQSKEHIAKNDIEFIGDLIVGVGTFDQLVFDDVFSKEYNIGCKYGGPYNSPQIWGFPLVDPDKIFNADGSLGDGGKFLKAKLERGLSDTRNTRIDHVMGLVNPYVYKADTVVYATKKDENGKEIQYPLRDKLKGGYLSETGLDKNHNYQKILERIILPTMREYNVDPDKVVWEDLGFDETGVFNKVFRDQQHLHGITGLIWTKGEEADKDNWAYIGCHDNPPVRMMIENNEVQNKEPWKAGYLSSYLRSDPYKADERAELKEQIKSDPRELMKAKFADLFRSSKNIQISFMDFFGINQKYNTPGTVGNDNWTLRLNPNYVDTYHKSLEKDDWALNLPEILKLAVQSKFDEEVSKNHKPYRETLNRVAPLMDELTHWENVLKEEE